MKKLFYSKYGFKSNRTSINERLYKLEDCLQSIPNNQRKIVPPFGNEFLPLSRDFTLKVSPILYPLRRNDICDYYPKCLNSSGLRFDDIITNILRNKKLESHDE